MANKLGNTVTALLIGTAIGAAIGILLAPDKGSNTRKKIIDGLDHDKQDLKNKFESASEEIKSKMDDVKFDLEETYENLVSNLSYKTEDVISFLETKLADLKKENAKYQK